jgi:hypothetical protein
MLRTVLAAGLAASVIGGAGVVTLRALGEDTKATFDTLNEGLADSAPESGKASAEDVADWIERYRADLSGTRCEKGTNGWDYVCSFTDSQGRRLKLGVLVDSRQPIQMSPAVRGRRPLAPPIGT